MMVRIVPRYEEMSRKNVIRTFIPPSQPMDGETCKNVR